jgi:hypothetical protein
LGTTGTGSGKDGGLHIHGVVEDEWISGAADNTQCLSVKSIAKMANEEVASDRQFAYKTLAVAAPVARHLHDSVDLSSCLGRDVANGSMGKLYAFMNPI